MIQRLLDLALQHHNPVNSTTMSIEDFVRIYGDNQTMMDSQFNPFIRENIPPMVLNVKIKKHDDWGVCYAIFVPYPCPKNPWTEIEVEAIDVADFSITIEIDGASKRSRTLEGKGHEWFEVKIDLDPMEVIFSYKVIVSMVDFAGNELDPPYEEEINGLFGGVLRFLEALWDFLVGVVTDIAEAVAKAVSFLIDWIVDAFISGIAGLLEAIANMVEPLVSGVVNQIQGIAASGPFDPWKSPLMMAPLVVSLYDVYKNVRNTFDAIEKTEIALSAIIMATGVGGVIKTILEKITLQTVKKVIQKMLVALAVGALAESVSKLLDRNEVEEWTKGTFGVGTAVTGIVLGAITIFESVSKYISKRKAEGIGMKSRYSAAVAFAVVGMAIALIGTVMEVKGLGLQLVDGLAIFFEIVALLTLTGKWWGKGKLLSPLATYLADVFGGATSTIEVILVGLGASSAFISIGLHSKDY